MEKKGSITVFLALILSLLLSLVATSIQSVQAAAARTQILNSMDIGLYSLFGQYDRFLLKNYDLFFLDGTQGGTDLNLAAVYDNFESYMKPILKQNSQKLKLRQGGFSGYRLATDEDGEVFYQQAVTYMKDTLGSQGVQTLVKRYKKKEQKVKQAEKDGKQAEAGNTLENYDSEMNSAAQKSQEAKEASKKEESVWDFWIWSFRHQKEFLIRKSHMEICYQEEHFNREWRCRRKREKIIPDQQKYCFSSI